MVVRVLPGRCSLLPFGHLIACAFAACLLPLPVVPDFTLALSAHTHAMLTAPRAHCTPLPTAPSQDPKSSVQPAHQSHCSGISGIARFINPSTR